MARDRTDPIVRIDPDPASTPGATLRERLLVQALRSLLSHLLLLRRLLIVARLPLLSCLPVLSRRPVLPRLPLLSRLPLVSRLILLSRLPLMTRLPLLALLGSVLLVPLHPVGAQEPRVEDRFRRQIDALLEEPGIQRAFEALEEMDESTIRDQIALTEIPA
ncbi:MAG: hypothetical protein R3223_12540, partial [Longimicrobiales bacterium]|nr:hypothetical protein [Longimicrobiales bacterium]